MNTNENVQFAAIKNIINNNEQTLVLLCGPEGIGRKTLLKRVLFEKENQIIHSHICPDYLYYIISVLFFYLQIPQEKCPIHRHPRNNFPSIGKVDV